MEESGSGTSPLVVALVATLSALIGAGATLGVAYFTFASKDQKVHLVEIAVSILRADPKEDVANARGWALDIIDKNSGVPFSAQDREALLHKPLSWKSRTFYWGIEGTDWPGFRAMFEEAFKKEGIPLPERQTPAEGK